MEGFGYVDMFATKGIEYLLVIGFLVAFIVFWKLLSKTSKPEVKMTARPAGSLSEWFHLAKNVYYHQGHAWAMPEGTEIVKVGIDDFAQKFLGNPGSINLPRVGSRIEQGEVGWKFQFDSKSIDMLSPVDGEIIEINENALNNPNLIGQDPYNEGWLLKVKVNKMKRNLKNLLSGKLAVAWMGETVNTLRQQMSGELGIVMQDGGLPVSGFARELSPDNWDEMAAEFFLTK